MRTKAKKWGNSLAIRIPQVIAEQLNISEDEELEMNVINQQIMISPRQLEDKLNELLAGISKHNPHKAVDFGKPLGYEIL